MDKTVSISLGGYAFTLDEAAYHKLKSYIDDIRRSLNSTEGIDEIISDVESRIAELLQPAVKNKEVVNVNNIDEVIAVMGKPEEYSDDELNEESKSRSYNTGTVGNGKKLFRDKSDAWIGGVCSGLANYFNIDVIWMRLIFVAPLIISWLDFGSMTGFMFIAYIVLWIIVPEARSTADRLEMLGKPVNFDSIKEFGEKAADNISNAAADAKPAAGRFLEIVGKILLILIGIKILFVGAGFIIGGIATLFTSLLGITPLGEFTSVIFSNNWLLYVGVFLLALVLIIPGVALVMLAFRLFSNRFKLKGRNFLIMGAIWLFSLIGAAIIGVTYSSNFWHDNKSYESKTYNIENDTIYISVEKFKKTQSENKTRWKSNNNGFFISDDKLYVDNVDFNIYESDDNQVKIELEIESRGKSWEDAEQNASLVDYNYQVNGNEIILDDLYSLDASEKFRAQHVKVNIYIPKGKTFHLKNLNWVDIYYDDGDNHRHGYKGKTYRIMDDEVQCFNCKDDDDYHYDRHEDWEDRLEREMNDLEDELRDLDLEDREIENLDVKINRNGVTIDISTDDGHEDRIEDDVEEIEEDNNEDEQAQEELKTENDDNDSLRIDR